MNKVGLRKGAWTAQEDALLKQCVQTYGEGNWYLIPNRAGLNRCRKSCRLRWLNYLKPGINRGEFQEDEVDLILRLHKLFGNKWSLIAGRLPGRTCNDIKNYWYTYIAKKLPKSTEEPISQGNKQQHQEEEEEDSVKVVAIRPIARRPTKTMQFGMNVVVGTTSNQPPPPLHGGINSEDNWWKRLVDDGNNYFGFGGGGCSASGGHCATASNCYDMQIGSPWAAGGGFTGDGDNPDDEIYIDNIFQP